MNELLQKSFNALTMSSREIATLCDKEHRNVCRDIENLNATYGQMGMLKIEQTPYTHEQNGQTYYEYQLTKEQTIDLITGYRADLRIKINRRWQELEQATTQVQVVGKAEDATRAALLLSQHLSIKGPALEVFLVTTVERIIGVEIPYRPLIEQRTYSATEIGEILGISANKVGRIANEHGLKTDELGMLYLSKSEYGPKQVEHFRYFEKAIDKFKSILEAE